MPMFIYVKTYKVFFRPQPVHSASHTQSNPHMSSLFPPVPHLLTGGGSN